MSKFIKLCGAVALVGLSAPVKASAMEVYSWSGCGGQNFASCATVVATYDAALMTLSFDVTNDAEAGWPGGFSAVGFAGLGGTLAVAANQTAPTGWKYFTGDAQGLDGPGRLDWVGFWNPGDGIAASTTGSFSILFTVSPPSFADFTFGFRETGLEGSDWAHMDCETSNRLHVNKDGTTYTETLDRDGDSECYNSFPDDPPTEVVPEPATMVLIATGLIGLAGAQLRRRKNTKV